MSIKIQIPTPLRQYTENLATVEAAGATVKEVLVQFGTTYPAVQRKLFDENGKKQQYVNLFLNDEDIRYLDNLDTAVKDGDELSIIPAIAGG